MKIKYPSFIGRIELKTANFRLIVLIFQVVKLTGSKYAMCDNCEWIDNRDWSKPENEKKYSRTDGEHEKVFEPIIVVHGYPDNSVEGKGTRCELILNAMKIMAVHGYLALLNHDCADDVVPMTVAQLEESKFVQATAVRGAILMNNRGKVGCVSALTTLDHPILLARRMMEEKHDVSIVQENIKGRKDSDLQQYSAAIYEDLEVLLSDIRSWGVIARDRNGDLAGGRSVWSLKKDKESSINVLMSVPGCGLLVDKKSCCSVSGDEQMIYLHAPARKIIQRLNDITSSTTIKNEINYYIEQYPDVCTAVVYLGASDEPLIVSHSVCFPWAYCHQGILKYGLSNTDESFSENIELDMPLDCRCKDRKK